jgi:hypothetical protein
MRSPIAAGILAVLFVMPALAGGPPELRSKHSPITDSDRAFWSFRPVKVVTPPEVKGDSWCRNPIDAFIVSSLHQHGLDPSGQADRVVLIRRATFDLHGLPPTPAEVDAFVKDPSSDAYERLLDRLLASPRYGERMARQWLDLVRYAESDGFKQDAYRPNAWRYRDYVIRSFNEDKPYDRFVAEQLAGDEVAPDDPNVIVATGYLRHWPYEYNQRDVPKQWADILSDVTDVTGDALLGLSVGCAKCHDHKFDPILQSDYYRLQAFFAPMLPRDDVPLASEAEQATFAKQQAEWERKTAVVRAQIAVIEAPFIRKTAEIALSKFPPETQAILAAPPAGRTPLEQQWAWLAYRQVYDPDENPPVKIDGKKDPALKERYESLKKELAATDADRPPPLAKGQVVGDVGPVAPPTYLPGDRSHVLEPGTPVVLDGAACKLPPIVPTANSTGRRTALAKWITDPANPLTARVMVNRVWQSHFGRGLVGTSSDFGHLGERPSHPELLDWLAGQFVTHGWSMKQMHRLIMTSAAYRQASEGSPSAQVAVTNDPENRLVWRMSPRRLDAEQVRDAMLAASGELSGDAGGPPVDAKVPRRSIYTKATRNTRDRLLDAFDAPESFCSVASRNCTTTPSQSLLLLNGEWPLKRAEAFAARVRREANTSDPSAQVDVAYRLAYCREPSAGERNRAASFLTRENGDAGLVDLCHVLLSSNEFLYVD